MSEVSILTYIISIKKVSQSTNPDSRMKCNPDFIETIPQILSNDDLGLLNNRLNGHLNDELNNTQFSEFIELCTLIQPLILHELDMYILRRVVVGFDNYTGRDLYYDLKNITKGMITSGRREYQSWTMKKSVSWLLMDRYESIAKDDSGTIMYMIEKTFPKESILIHIPSLVHILGEFGFKDLYDGFFDKEGLHTEEEVIVKTNTEIEYENLWFFTMGKKSFDKTLYEKTSGVVKIPLVEGGCAELEMIYF